MKESCCGSNQRPVSDVQLRRFASISLACVFSKLMQWYMKFTSLYVDSHDVIKTTMCFLFICQGVTVYTSLLICMSIMRVFLLYCMYFISKISYKFNSVY